MAQPSAHHVHDDTVKATSDRNRNGVSESFEHPSLTDWVNQSSSDSVLKEADKSAQIAREQAKVAQKEAEISYTIEQFPKSEHLIFGSKQFPTSLKNNHSLVYGNTHTGDDNSRALLIGDSKAIKASCRIEWTCGDKYAGQCRQVFIFMLCINL